MATVVQHAAEIAEQTAGCALEQMKPELAVKERMPRKRQVLVSTTGIAGVCLPVVMTRGDEILKPGGDPDTFCLAVATRLS